MTEFSRREFVEMSAGIGVAVGVGPAARSSTTDARADGAELIVQNGTVYTVDPNLPVAEAFAVRDGKFIAVGSTDDVRNLLTPQTEVIDASEFTVVPGFIDAHCHPAWSGVRELVEVKLETLRTIAAIKNALRARAATTPPGEWVLGHMYDDTKVDGGRQITVHDLDEAVPNHPVRVNHRGGHVQWYNSRAFELAGITAETPDPPGGHFYREDGALTGRVAERATAALTALIPSETTAEQRRDAVSLMSQEMTAAGLTSVHDAGCSSEDLVAYQDALAAGALHFRVYAGLRGAALDPLKESGVRTGFGNEWLRVGYLKYVADGSTSGRTMRMSTPYVGRPNDYGILTMTQEEINEVTEAAHRQGYQVGIHANGDVTIDMVLQAYERVQQRWPRPDPRHRLEHCSLVNPDLLRRMKALGAIPTPFHTYLYFHGDTWGEYGPAKMRWMFAHRSFQEYDIPVAGASDYWAGPYEPMMALQSMVTRKDSKGRTWGLEQRVDVDQALRITTLHGAHASFEERIKGSITVGKLADFVMLSADPHTVDPDRIIDTRIVRTVVGGHTKYEA